MKQKKYLASASSQIEVTEYLLTEMTKVKLMPKHDNLKNDQTKRKPMNDFNNILLLSIINIHIFYSYSYILNNIILKVDVLCQIRIRPR